MRNPSSSFSPLRDEHLKCGAKFGDEAGLAVPLSYGDAPGEARELLERAGLADMSHNGRIRLRGDDALPLLERLCTHDVARQEDDTATATLLCNERGGIVSPAHLLRLEEEWLFLTPALTREKVLDHLREHQGGLSVKIDDQTPRTAELLLAGPEAAEILDGVLPLAISDLADGGVMCGSMLIAPYTAVRLDVGSVWCGRVVLPAAMAGQAWAYMTTRANGRPVRPVGQSALDAIRVEQGLPRYGYELNETIDPATAGLLACVSGRGDFLGAGAIAELSKRSPSRRRVRLALSNTAPSIPRLGDAVFNADSDEIGTVSSGTWSVTRECPVALAYIAASHDENTVFVHTDGVRVEATVL